MVQFNQQQPGAPINCSGSFVFTGADDTAVTSTVGDLINALPYKNINYAVQATLSGTNTDSDATGGMTASFFPIGAPVTDFSVTWSNDSFGVPIELTLGMAATASASASSIALELQQTLAQKDVQPLAPYLFPAVSIVHENDSSSGTVTLNWWVWGN